MKAEIIKIGNSKGLRIPKSILKQCGMNDKVSLAVRDRQLIVTSIDSVRDGWEEAMQNMVNNNDDKLLDIGIDNINHSFDEEEWQW